jgi:hypothetical protein
MKSLKIIGLCAFLIHSLAAVTAGAQFRTDINPAMLYYQAFNLAPDFSPAEREYLFERDWRGQKLPEKFGELVSHYDNQFKLVRQAAQAIVPCDWGIDMTPGPATLLPHLARVKGIVQAARLRALWFLQQGRPAEARDDLLAAFVLARNCSRDGTLIAMLVQIAGENIVCSTIAENFYQFSPELLKQFIEGFDAAPVRNTAAACIPTEKEFFLNWLVRKVVDLQKENPGDDSKVMAGIHDLMVSMEGVEEGHTNTAPTTIWDKTVKAAGGTSLGILKLLQDEGQFYDRLAVILTLPLAEYEEQIKPFTAEVQNSSNPIVELSFPAIQKCRQKEFGILVTLAMVRAAVEYRLLGEEGLKNVNDPCGSGPFEFQRFVFEGVDRGFELKSPYTGRGFQEKMIFVEKDGPAFHVTGPKAEKAVEKSSNGK